MVGVAEKGEAKPTKFISKMKNNNGDRRTLRL